MSLFYNGKNTAKNTLKIGRTRQKADTFYLANNIKSLNQA